MTFIIVAAVNQRYQLLEMRVICDQDLRAIIVLPLLVQQLTVQSLNPIALDEEEFAPERISRVEGHLVFELGEESAHHVHHYTRLGFLFIQMDGLAGKGVSLPRIRTAQTKDHGGETFKHQIGRDPQYILKEFLIIIVGRISTWIDNYILSTWNFLWSPSSRPQSIRWLKLT